MILLFILVLYEQSKQQKLLQSNFLMQRYLKTIGFVNSISLILSKEKNGKNTMHSFRHGKIDIQKKLQVQKIEEMYKNEQEHASMT